MNHDKLRQSAKRAVHATGTPFGEYAYALAILTLLDEIAAQQAALKALEAQE